MKYFFKMFWNDKGVAERVWRALFIGAGTSLVALEGGPPWVKPLGAGLAAMGALISSTGEKNANKA